eukprot:CAMPEP_0119159888 /NCGR_PEP_ID=MMETSP1310-20130426/53988_1 /TAXON_ID=464262 /ORGANISM="Genus nov. species nov., Strain RCC2339" /LENGTH=134 /DNA_ID=CAMNT_0007152517 /DNA_START=573 /DNA_END=974 /DNA_ORIENTATION=+
MDMDVLVRTDLLRYLKWESEELGTCIIYCTHIFDGIGNWATDVLHLANGRVMHSCKLHPSAIPELSELLVKHHKNTKPESDDASDWNIGDSVLFQLAEMWLRIDRIETRRLLAERRGTKTKPLVERLAEKDDKF